MITHVAIRYHGKIYSLPKPNRHHHIIQIIFDETGKQLDNDEQGFLDDAGNFLDRESALIHATASGQLRLDTRHHSLLFSEDIW